MPIISSGVGGAFNGGTVGGAVTIQPTDPATVPLTINPLATVTGEVLEVDGDAGGTIVGHNGDWTIAALAGMGADLLTLGFVDAFAHNILAVAQNFAPFGLPLRVNADGYLVLKQNAAPADAALAAGEVSFWLDSTNGAAKLMVKAKQADGTVRTGSLALS